MNAFIHFLEIAGIVLAGIIVLYFFVRILSGTDLVISTSACACKEFEADQFYYLPSYGITLKVRATVTVKRKSGEEPTWFLKSLTLDPVVDIQPDTKNLIALRYCDNWFSNDDIQILTSEKSLIQNIGVISEDRISNIVSQIVKAPEEAIDQSRSIAAFGPEAETAITADYEINNSFKIGPEEVATRSIELKWTLPLTEWEDQNEVEIKLSFKGEGTVAQQIPTAYFTGIFTRPMANQTWKLQKTDTNKFDVSFSCFGPDSSRLIKLPIRSSFFVKKQQFPKFSNGILVENHIVKPSEIEGFISIPINILKAIVSIPSALLQFKITNVKKELELEKNTSELQKLRNPPSPDPAQTTAKNDLNVDDLQKQLKLLEAALKDRNEKSNEQQDTVPKLGKLPAEERAQSSARLKELQQDLFNKGEIVAEAVTVVPESCYWHSRFTGNWMSYNNEKVMNCVPAAAAHMIMCWTCNTRANTTQLTLQQVMAAYSRESGYDPATGANDNGCATISFLRNWKNPGISQNKIREFVDLNKGDQEELKLAISLFGACMIGFKMPNSAKNQTNTWEITDPNNQLGEWGPHAVAAIGYDNDSLLIVSWGRLIQAKWDFYKKYNDEGFSVLTDDWFKNGKSPAGQDLATLETLLENFV